MANGRPADLLAPLVAGSAMTASDACWICGNSANSREHRVKRSDLKYIAGTPTQEKPLFLHTDKRRNRRIGSLNADALKFTSGLCHYCNTTRTQGHDLAWQHLSEFLLSHQPPMRAGQFIRANSIFPYDTRSAMRGVHLYIVKLFGCMVMGGNVTSIDITTFADAILRNRFHPNIYAAFGPAPEGTGKAIAGASNLEVLTLDGRCAYAVWIHHVADLWVQIMFAADGERRKGLERAWHPRFGHKGFLMAEF